MGGTVPADGPRRVALLAVVTICSLAMLLPAGQPMADAAPLEGIIWREPTVLQDNGDESQEVGSVDIYTDAHGNAYLAWADWRHTFGAPYARVRYADGTWSMARNVDSAGWDEQNEVPPSICADGSGNVFVVWIDQDTTAQDRVVMVRSPDGGRNWTDNIDLTGDTPPPTMRSLTWQ